ncbi:hypothetical protein D3C86_1353720 [compost metagenome]
MAIDNDLVLADFGAEAALVAFLPGRPFALHVVDHEIAAFVRMSNHPAADLARAELYEFLITGGHGHLQGRTADNQ